MQIEDYIPKNLSLIKGKGIAITNLPGDAIGLKVGLKVTKDILGNPIGDALDVGAIAVSSISGLKKLKSYNSVVFSANGRITVIDEKASVLTLFTITGMELRTDKFKGTLSIPCAKGLYIVKVNNEIHKVIVD